MKPRAPISLSNMRNRNHKVLDQPWRNFTSLKLCQSSPIPQPPPRVTSTSNRIKTITIGLMIYKQPTNTKLHHLIHGMTEGMLPHPWGEARKPWTNFPPLFP